MVTRRHRYPRGATSIFGFKAPYNPKERIWQEADRLRAAHPAGRSLPVQVLDLAEFDLGLDLIPANGLREQLDIEALLMGDLRSILVDRHAFMSPRLEYRLRFSVAHEIGHLILHATSTPAYNTPRRKSSLGKICELRPLSCK